MPRQGHGHNRSAHKTQKNLAQRAVIKMKVLFEHRNMRRPQTKSCPIHQEQNRERPLRPLNPHFPIRAVFSQLRFMKYQIDLDNLTE